MFSRKEPKQHLLGLPAELREQIFIYAVSSKKPVVTFRLDSYQRDSYQEAVQPSITRVSRQVRREALPLFYDANEFVVHSEGSKVEDALMWFRCSQPHLPRLFRLAIWVRYIPLPTEHAASSGAMSVTMRHNVHSGVWEVDEEWRWITVVRRPAQLAFDGELLVRILSDLIAAKSRITMSVEDYATLLENLRMAYFKDKMS